MTIKIQFNQEIHRFAKFSPNLGAFISAIRSAFKDTLPQYWTLSYTDLEGDTIMVTHASDYEELLALYSQDVSLTLRLFVIPVDSQAYKYEDAVNSNQLAKSNEKIESEEKEQEEYNMESNQIQKDDEIDSKNNMEKVIEESASKKPESNQEVEPQATPQPLKEEDKAMAKFKNLLTKLIMGQIADDKKDQATAKLKKFEEALTAEQKEEFQKKREEIEVFIEKRKLKQQKLAAKLAKEQKQKDITIQPIDKKEEKEETLNIPDSAPQGNQELVENLKIISNQIKCNGCVISLKSGVVYKCSECKEFYFCEACEDTKVHPHLFLKVKDLALLEKERAAAAKKPECPYAVFQRLIEDLKKGNTDKARKYCNKYLMKLPEEMRATLTSLFGSLSEETKEKVKEALIGLKEKAFSKDNCSCVEEREKLREDQKVFRELKQKTVKVQGESKLKLKEQWTAFKSFQKTEKERIAEEWKKLRQNKKEETEKLKEKWTKLRERIALEKEKAVAQKKKDVAKMKVGKKNGQEEAGKAQEDENKLKEEVSVV